MQTKFNFVSIFVILTLILAGCASQQESITPTPSPPPTNTPTPLPTSTPTIPPTPQPTAVGGSNGSIVIDDYDGNFFVVDLNTGERKTLISQSQLESLLPPNRSGDSYDYAGDYVAPPQISLSPDLTKVYVSICANLDNKFRCIPDDFIYDIETQSLTKLDKPAGEYGVYWQWSSDGSKLAGEGWRWQFGQYGQEYASTAFYVINSDGSNLKAIAPKTTWDMKLAWNPNGKIVYPLTFASNLQAVNVDTGESVDVTIEELKVDDKIDCLTFSNNGEKVAFAVTRDTQKGYYWIYTANSDFTNISLISEFDTDSHYGCGITLSPDNKFILIGYSYRYISGGAEWSSLSILLNVEMNSEVNFPQADFCGWTPDGSLVYLKEWEAKIFDLSTSKEFNLPQSIKKCPIQWLQRDLSFQLSAEMSTLNACHPGDIIKDEIDVLEISPYFDIQEVSSSLDGETLTVTFYLKSVNDDLSVYMNTGRNNYLNGWRVKIDVDNNILSGDNEGFEYRFNVIAWNGSDGNTPSLSGDLEKYSPNNDSYTKAGRIEVILDSKNKIITFVGKIPEITPDARLAFESSKIDLVDSIGLATVDEICK